MAFTEGFWTAGLQGTVQRMQDCLLGWGPKADFPSAVSGNKGKMAIATDENDQPYYSDGSTWVQAFRPILTVAETQVFSGNAPTTWTDLDLSGTVGSNAALVLLKIKIGSTGALAVRKNGDTDEFYYASKNYGVALIDTLSSEFAAVLVATDSSGVIEWTAENAVATTTIDIIAYIK